MKKRKINLIMPVLLVLAAVFILFTLFKLVMREVPPVNPEGTAQEERVPVPGDMDYVLPPVIDYHPLPDASFDYPEYRGTCVAGSIYSSRSDIYTCSSGEDKFDVCFLLPNGQSLLCGVDPENGQSGVFFLAENELKTAASVDIKGQNEFFLIRIDDGTACYPVGALELTVRGVKAKYQCYRDDVTAIFNEPVQKNGSWVVDTAVLQFDENGKVWSVVSTKSEQAAHVWR